MLGETGGYLQLLLSLSRLLGKVIVVVGIGSGLAERMRREFFRSAFAQICMGFLFFWLQFGAETVSFLFYFAKQ